MTIARIVIAVRFAIAELDHLDTTFHSSRFTQRLLKELSYSDFTMRRQALKQITLNSVEERIRQVLVQFFTQYNTNVPSDKQLELRITGGWVRDKLLGKESNDLDIAINVLSGQEFATKLLEWASKNNHDLGGNTRGLHTIKKNPEKSKHLETCTTKLFGLDVDFVNLRSERYSDDSRVPVIECGTAEEDAMRRDATLNALFYNLNNEKVEDFTKRGLRDLQDGILRTPLQPLQTFLDDPLRMLRLIRFACRFNFTIEHDTIESMKNEKMKETLLHKISRERVGVEMHKILTSQNVPYGLRLLNYVDLTNCIFNVGSMNDTIKDINTPELLRDIMDCNHAVKQRVDVATRYFPFFVEKASATPRLGAQLKKVLGSPMDKKLFWLCVILQPYGDIKVRTSTKRQSTMNYVELILKEGLRFGKTDYEDAAKIVAPMNDHALLSKFFANPQGVPRSELGLYIRQFGERFDVNIAVNAFNDYLKCTAPGAFQAEITPEANTTSIDLEGADKTLANFESLLATIDNENLLEVKDLKGIIDGKIIAKALQRKPGPWMSKISTEVLRWQLDNPEGTPDECLEYIRGWCQSEEAA